VARLLDLTPDESATLGKIAAGFPGLAEAVRTQVARVIATVLPAADGAIATEAQLDALLESVIERVVIGRGQSRSDPPTDLDVAVDAMVLLLVRDAVARRRLELVERVLG